MATRRLSLILQLKDHRTIVDSMKAMASQSQSMATATAKQRQEVDALETAYRRLQSTITGAASAAARLGGNGGPGGSPNNFGTAPNVAPSGGSGGGAGSGGGGGSLAYASGPYQRMAKLQEQIKRYMQGGGTTEEGKDLRLAWEKNQAQIKKLENPDPGKSRMQLLGEAVLTSRFGAGGLQPLVGRSLSALGVGGAAAGPVAIAATAAIALAQALYKLTAASAAATQSFTQAQSISGGTGYESARLQSLGIGADASRGLLGRITSDPAALGVAAKLGVSAMPGPYGTMDSAGTMLKVVESLRAESGEQQRRDMRILGLEGFGGLMKISDGTFQLLKRDSRITARIMNPGQQARAAEFGVAGQRLVDSSQNLMTVLSGPLMKDITDWQNGLATNLNQVANWFSQHTEGIQKIWDAYKWEVFPGEMLGQKLQKIVGQNGFGGAASGEADEDSATKENTEALRRLNHTFQKSANADRAYPSALRGDGMHRALAAGALPRGAI